MLSSITRRYRDKSTIEYFQFEFYCDKCGDLWTSEQYPFSLANDKQKSNREQKVRDLIWVAEHNAAYERANTEAILHFNKCSVCGKRVCDKCFSEFGDTCADCNKN